MSASLVSAILKKTEPFLHSSNGFLTIKRDHARWSVTDNRKQKNHVKFLVLKVVATWALQISEKWLPTRVFETVFDWKTKWLFTKWSLMGGELLMRSGPAAMGELTVPCKRKSTIQSKERMDQMGLWPQKSHSSHINSSYNEFTTHLKRISSSLKFTLHQSHAIICFPLKLFNRLYKNLILIA